MHDHSLRLAPSADWIAHYSASGINQVDVTDWLKQLGLEQYSAAFRENDIDNRVLCRLTAEDLRELGIASIGHRRRLLEAIAALEIEKLGGPELSGNATRSEVGERRVLTVVFCDVVGSTKLATLYDPEDLSALIRDYQSCVSATITRFGGYIARYVGDGVLIYFGWPQAREKTLSKPSEVRWR